MTIANRITGNTEQQDAGCSSFNFLQSIHVRFKWLAKSGL
jgi:hypothetical protein